MKLYQIVNKNKKLVVRYAKSFQELFGVPIQTFMHPLIGFDIVSFDSQIIRSKKKESMRECIKRKYGIAAVKLIEHLI